MSLTSIDGALWGISVAGQFLLLAVLLRQRLYRAFPLFCVYIAYTCLSDIGLFILYSHTSQVEAYRMYSMSSGMDILLEVGVLLEIGQNVLNPVKRSLPRASLYIFAAMFAATALIMFLFAIHWPPSEADRWAQYFLHLSYAVAILRLLIFSAIAGFSQLLGIGWKNHVLQIATGLLAYSVVVLFVELLHRFTGLKNQSLYHLHDQFRIISWCMVLGYWSYSLSRVEAARKEFSPKMTEFLVSMSEVARSNRTASARWYRK